MALHGHRNVLPKRLPSAGFVAKTAVRPVPLSIEIARLPPHSVYSRLLTCSAGLSEDEAARRLRETGPNVVARNESHPSLRLLARALLNPLVILLLILASFAFLTGDPRAGGVMVVMVVIGVTLRFVQEARADRAAARLRAMIAVRATVLRDGRPQEVPVSHVVPGDIVELAAGDMIPADLRLVACKDLFVIQASLTGEAFPVEKHVEVMTAAGTSPLEAMNLCFLGTSVESGTGTGVVVTTGRATLLGCLAHALEQEPPPTAFDRGVSRFTWLMISLIGVLVPLVFIINWATKGDLREAFFFALAVAVGLTPEMLPMIVTVCLSKGALALSQRRVIIKRLNSIQNLGAMDLLCTDKTGTLTMDRIVLEKHCDVALQPDREVLALAYLNSHFQTGLRNVMDRAVLDHTEMHEHLSLPGYVKVDEIPFDFSRRVMSVVVRMPEGQNRLICKGAPEAVFARCSGFLLDDEISPMDHVMLVDLREELDQLSADGFRVLAVAYRDVVPQAAYSKDDERDLVLRGYLAFLDPPKETARKTLIALRERGVQVKVLTGDNELVSRKICQDVGIDTKQCLLGSDVEAMSDDVLATAVEGITLFARLAPAHKRRVIQALQGRGHVVGFLGDGINDAPALRAADVGISVDTAVDIAKESADAILLEKDLGVLAEGVVEGRKVFANVLKYVRMGASSNFGNVLSVVGASVLLPFLPMLPIQILTNNLLYDFSQVPIPTDDVDPEQVAGPQPWSMGAILRYILVLGPCSSLFDYVTFFVLLYGFGCWDPARASLFQTGWFVESLVTQTLIIHVIRTNRIPFFQSRASWPLSVTTTLVMLVGVWLPYSPLAPTLGFTPLPWIYLPVVATIVLGYLALTQVAKTWLNRSAGKGDHAVESNHAVS